MAFFASALGITARKAVLEVHLGAHKRSVLHVDVVVGVILFVFRTEDILSFYILVEIQLVYVSILLLAELHQLREIQPEAHRLSFQIVVALPFLSYGLRVGDGKVHNGLLGVGKVDGEVLSRDLFVTLFTLDVSLAGYEHLVALKEGICGVEFGELPNDEMFLHLFPLFLF